MDTHDALNSSGLLMASEAGILSVEPWLSTELSDVELSFVDVVEEYLPNAVLDLGKRLMTSRAVPLLEPGAHSVFLSGEGEAPAFQAAATGPALDRRAVVAAALAAQLPDLRLVPIDEVIGLRAALKDYLPAFRLEVVKLADEIAADGALDATQLATEVEKRWERDLAPQLQEIREKVRTLAYPRKLLASLVEDKGTLSATASSVVLAVGSVYAGVGTLLPAAAAATYPLLKALNDTLSDRDEARRNRLYFLYGAQERLRRRRRDSRLEEAT